MYVVLNNKMHEIFVTGTLHVYENTDDFLSFVVNFSTENPRGVCKCMYRHRNDLFGARIALILC